MRARRVRASALIALLALPAAHAQSRGASDWGYYGGDSFGRRFSSLDQINRGNVAQLKLAWVYRTGELGAGFARARKLTFEATPVLAYGSLYLETATNIVIALDAQTGVQRWRFDPHVDRARHYSEAAARGVSLWEDSERHQMPLRCLRRVFTGTLDARLLALDADTGLPCVGFGNKGEVNLAAGIHIRDAGAYLVTSPPAIYGNLVIVGSAIGDNRAVSVERGVIRAFDARSGALAWAFDPLPDSPEHPAVADWQLAQAAQHRGRQRLGRDERGRGAWPGADPHRFGQPGLLRRAARRRRIALPIRCWCWRPRTGRVAWQQQLVHHDLWDYDLAAQPVLGDIEVGGAPVPAVIQATKTGMLYVFERTHGRPLFPVTERPVPASRVPGEQAARTQPFSALPALVPQAPVRPEDAWGITFWDRGKCRALIASLRNEGIFSPPDLGGTLLTPGYLGGVNWGGVVFDEQRQRVIAAVNNLPMVVTLLTPQELEFQTRLGPVSARGVRPPERRALWRAPRAAALASGPAVHPAAVGDAGKRRPAAQPHRLAGAARLDRGPHALVPAGARVRHAQHGRSDRHRRRPGVRRRRHRQLPARL